MSVTYTNIGGYQIPVYDQSTFKPWQRDILGTVDAGDGSNYGVIGQENAWGLDHNDAYSLYGANSPYNYWANWSLTKPGQGVNDAGGFGYDIDPSGFDGLLKVGDKEGLRVRYSLQDGKYVPSLVGKEGWNSNRDNTGDFTALAMALTAGAAGYLAPAAQAATGGGMAAGEGAMIGSGLNSVADLGMGAGLGAGGMAAGEGAMIGNGLNSVADLGGGGLLGNLGSSLGSYVTDPKNIPTLIKAGSMIGGLLGDNGSSGGSSGIPTMTPVPAPTMYGQGSASGGLLGGSWGALGPTETERRMRQQYLPSLLGSGPWSN